MICVNCQVRLGKKLAGIECSEMKDDHYEVDDIEGSYRLQ